MRQPNVFVTGSTFRETRVNTRSIENGAMNSATEVPLAADIETNTVTHLAGPHSPSGGTVG